MRKRIVKNPEVRQKEILNAAQKLFEEKGYENTPVEAIIKAADIAKGTFYYYFKTKKDVLTTLVENIGAEMEAHFSSIVANENLTALKKLKMMIRGTEKEAIVQSTVMEIIHKPENRELQEKLNIYSLEVIAPLLVQVLEQGYKEGVFNKIASLESIQLILAGSQFILESGLFELSSQKRMAYLKALQTMFENEVGAKSGSLSFISKK
jgi:AcrR family transcriptional regulator